MSLTKSEQAVFDELKSAGFVVLRDGWPDFLIMNEKEIRCIEVKSGSSPLSKSQKLMHSALKKCGISVDVRSVKTGCHNITARLDEQSWKEFMNVVESTKRSVSSILIECLEYRLPLIIRLNKLKSNK